MNWITTYLSEIAATPYFFFSNRFFILKNEINQNKDFFEVPLSEFFDITSGYAFKSDDYIENGIKLLRISDFSNHFGIDYSEMVSLPEDYEILFSRFKIEKSDILIAMTGATIGKASIVGVVQEPLLLNQRVGLLRRKDGVQISERVYYHIMKQRALQFQILIKSMGKSQPNVSPFDILKCKVPSIPSNTQFQIERKIIEVERNIRALVDRRKEPHKIINEIFAEEFSFDRMEFNQANSIRQFSLSLSSFSYNRDLRFGFRFHNRGMVYLEMIMKQQTSKKIKDILSKPIVLGKGVSPSEYKEDGDYYYIAMSNIKKWKFDPIDCKRIGKEFYTLNSNKTISVNDIIMARSGEGTIGKVALINDENIEGVFADFTMRIRLSVINPLFAYYYFCSGIFQHYIYTHKKGLGNNTNIFPSQVQEFPFPDFDIKRQQEIADRIKKTLDKQKTIEIQIKEKQNEISKIIEEAIK